MRPILGPIREAMDISRGPAQLEDALGPVIPAEFRVHRVDGWNAKAHGRR